MPKRLIPKAGPGERVYDAMTHRKRDDGSVWQPEDLADCVGVSATAARSWITRGTMPKGENLQKLAECLNVTVEYLVSGRNFEDKSDKSGVSRISPNNPDHSATRGGGRMWGGINEGTMVSGQFDAMVSRSALSRFLEEVLRLEGIAEEYFDAGHTGLGAALFAAAMSLRMAHTQADAASFMGYHAEDVDPLLMVPSKSDLIDTILNHMVLRQMNRRRQASSGGRMPRPTSEEIQEVLDDIRHDLYGDADATGESGG